MSSSLSLTVLMVYVAALFLLAARGERIWPQVEGRADLRRSIYVLGLGVYCTSWTFFGAVGEAERNGWDYLPIYLGPALIFLLAPGLIRRLAHLGREHNTASIADFLSARYGKSAAVGAVSAFVLLIASLPYIALQLRSAATSLDLMGGEALPIDAALLAALALAAFAILFGARRPDSAQGNGGLALAIAIESGVKLAAMLAVGGLALWILFDLPAAERAAAPAAQALAVWPADLRFLTLTGLAALAALCLPRQFHMMVVEARRPEDARASRFGFPLYLAAVALIAPPAALAGGAVLGGDPDAYVLALPLAFDAEALALLVFIGGFSAAAGMVTIAALALSTMIVNDVLGPLILREGRDQDAEGLARRLLTYRRIAILALLAAAYLFHRGMNAPPGLASIGLIAFAGAAQLAPALLLGLYWERGGRRAALAGIGCGGAAWAVMILIPAYAGGDPIAPGGMDPFSFAVLASLGVNLLAYVLAVALFPDQGLADRMQAEAFTRRDAGIKAFPAPADARIADLDLLMRRVLGETEGLAAMMVLSREVGRTLTPDEAMTPALAGLAEARLARAVGAASARLLLTRVVSGDRVAPDEVVALLDETAEKIRSSEDRLAESERSVRFYTDNFPAMMSYSDRDLVLRFANQAYLDFFGLGGGAIGTRLADFMSPSAYAERAPRMQAALKGEAQVFDIDQRDESGRGRVWQVAYQPRVEDGEVVGFFGAYQDVTARRLAEEGLERANETLEEQVEKRTAEARAAREEAEAATASKTRFLAAASHDLLQPLSAARLLTSALEDELKDAPEDTRRLAGRIDTAIANADQLLRALLDISRLDAGGVKPETADTALGPLIEDIVGQFAPRAADKGLDLRVMPTRLAVHTDPGLISSVLQNLVSNAVRYTESGRILVGARRRGPDQIALIIADTGPGIAPEEQERIFGEFQQVGKKSGDDRGLGLGLAIVERILKRLDHPISLHSAPGAGSRFEVLLPRAESAAAPRRRHRGASLEGLRVLCLDNEPSVLDATLAVLRGWGCEAEGAADREAARRAFAGAPPDVAVLDYRLDDGDTGPEAYEALCREWGRRPPGLLATAERGGEADEAAARSGLDVLRKPVPPAALRAAIAALKRRAAHMEIS